MGAASARATMCDNYEAGLAWVATTLDGGSAFNGMESGG